MLLCLDLLVTRFRVKELDLVMLDGAITIASAYRRALVDFCERFGWTNRPQLLSRVDFS